MLSTKLTLSLAASVALLGSACVGDVSISKDPPPVNEDPDNPSNPTDPESANERVLFQTTVEPILQANCAGAGCHDAISPVFTGGSDMYSDVMANSTLHGGFTVEAAGMLNKIDAGHQGIVYSTEERQSITTWILAEAALGQDSVPDLKLSDREALAQFSGCMTKENWDIADMNDWARTNAEGNQCRGCHSQGLSDFNTNDDNEIMFQMNRRLEPNPFIMGFFTVGRDELTGDAMVIPAHIKLELMSLGGGEGGIHPRYTYDENDDDYIRLEQFYNLTMDYMEANPACKDIGFPAL